MKPKQSIRHVATSTLRPHDRNRRLDLDRVEEMADSMREHGVLMPLVVTEHPIDFGRGHWLLLDGHYRAAAARMAGLSTVPVVIRHDLDADLDEQLVIMLVANSQRQDLSAIDRAEMLGQLRDKQGMSLAEISRRTGLSASRVSESLALLDLDTDTRDRVRDGQVGVGQATQAVRQFRAAARSAARVGKPQAKPDRRIALEAAWFTFKHQLADRAHELCSHTNAAEGRVRPMVGGVACGECWERAIREDEAGKVTTPEGVSA